jgi:hypothetical protein
MSVRGSTGQVECLRFDHASGHSCPRIRGNKKRGLKKQLLLVRM